MKHSNVFYKRNKDGEYEALKDAKAVRNKAGFDLYRIDFLVCEGKTGLIVSYCYNMDQIQAFVSKLETDAAERERFERAINDSVEKKGLSPRYTSPDERYDELFPKPDKKEVLAPALDGKKHFYSEVYNQDGIALYIQKTQKAEPWAYLYLLYDGWMIDVGNLSQKDIRIEEYKDGIPNYRQIMTDRLEEALAIPDKWANMYFADFLGRSEEAQAHNQPIHEAREAERQAEREERDRCEEEKRLDEQREYEATIFDAEQSILHKREVLNGDVRSTSLILQLFRENGVELPLKTQGWVKSSLYSIYFHADQEWSYRYSGRPSTVIHGYLDKLAEAVEKKYQQMPEPDATHEPDNEEEMEL